MSDLKFLIVDDSPTMRRIVTNTLKRLGYRDIIEADQGQAALDQLRLNEDVTFIVTDWNMPIMDGLTFVTAVRKTPAYAKLPILMVTTRSVKEDIIEAMKAGVNNYVVKPFTPETMKSKIDAILARMKK